MAKELEFVKKEEEILDFWFQHNIFEQSIQNREGKPDFIFYEGPPTANGKPGIHHVLARSFKDAICRYKTMRGFRVLRKAGWDTHGLPVELEVEKSLGFYNKTDIEKYGIKEFNQKAKESVWQYKEEWEKLTKRMAYWIDTKNPYITFENNYIETIWWLIKQINEKGLLYKSYKVLPYCPRCSTPLSSHEVAQGYETVQDPSIYIKFEISNPNSSLLKSLKIENLKLKIFLLVWTTTPWTLIANTAIAVDKNLDYKIFKVDDEYLISFKDLPDGKGEKITTIKGADLIGLHYQPLYEIDTDFILSSGKQYEVVAADFITTEEGTGLVHIAPAFGEDDMNLKNALGLALIKHIDDKGHVIFDVNDLNLQGKFFKDIDPLIFDDLNKRNLLYQGDLKGTTHEYPFCWRCHTPLLYFAFEAWYIKMSQLREDLLKNNELINWVPEHIKYGRFGQWLKEIKDWTISRNRYWGTPLPIWECDECHHYEVIGSVEELREKAINHDLPEDTNHNLDLHRPFVDQIKIPCPKCGNLMSRRQEVLDCWFDSGAMPYAQYHFPFEQFKERNLPISEMIKTIPFPADYISEAIDQTRGWFYTLLAISTLLDLGPSFKNVICLGLILDKKGEKMSKSKGNVVEPLEIMEKYGADTLRWYLYTINSPGEEKRFNENDLITIQRNVFNILWNVLIFYDTYADKKIISEQNLSLDFDKLNILNQWILSDLQQLKIKVLNNLDKYYIYEATKEINKFIDDLSHWYIRRSRSIFQRGENLAHLQQSSLVLYKVLKELSLLLAPFCPFLAESLWQKLKLKTDAVSVHLADYPEVESQYLNKELLDLMEEARAIANLALSLRQKANIKVRQPLASLKLKTQNSKIKNYSQLLDILKEEINVKEIVFDPNLKEEMEIDTTLTPDLIKEGILREIIRQIQELRKNKQLTPQDTISIEFFTEENDLLNLIKEQSEEIQRKTLALNLLTLSEKLPDTNDQISVEGKIILVRITKQ
ncbi:MAG: isoleucine--tRNA ligase [Parcubacteria group bacterium]|nr:isoleucine--tRNA ligase [Parcubacteria group bacterium]